MFGALIGDIVGSVYEFNNIKTKDFPLISKDSIYTDDSVMTLAVLDILLNGYINDKDKIIDTFKKWGKSYPDAGYGGHFRYWVLGDSREPYNSCGNGSAMRVSPCGWFGNSEKEVIDYATKVTEVKYFGVNIVGRVQNNTTKKGTLVYIVANLFDVNNKLICNTFSILDDDLNPGDKIGFSMSPFGYDDFSSSDIYSYEIFAYPLQYNW